MRGQLRSIITSAISGIFILLLFIATANSDTAQYLYDASGRLCAVIDAQGNEKIYNYDSVGNLFSITDNPLTSTDSLSIIDFDPKSGPVSTEVVIYGKRS